ncbi:plasmid mobilization relaxosome protein MobC [[Ruminococcus] gnavus]|uniref:Plasmid mobilization relaxosome protein MobC n=1 Tax=Mediterraneibacter gnavus TaxID=33038 RepID=A0A412BP62_MEDGN|nr:plasmid mobilization relaxosome protein MobC [Mediterraneibacter gnavus]MDB8707580.1 plasmid mobilization relaxosome protein MobC [Mediterraneibacter gnavus]MDB8721446.1 plasmid mobilization relaxosome protein MobC [Mediterraneibacter gnavus]RGQ58661.1 plasmid mobilization relaxosome protein MobC [Mediterraneibacter gnavus]
MKRSIFVGVRFQPEEYEFLCEKAEKDPETRMRTGSKNLSAYVRKKTLQESGYQKELQIQKELKELVYQFRKIGTNINQATKQLHIGYEPAAAADRLEKNMTILEQKMEMLREELKRIYSNQEERKE